MLTDCELPIFQAIFKERQFKKMYLSVVQLRHDWVHVRLPQRGQEGSEGGH
jgi:hypothetical protein